MRNYGYTSKCNNWNWIFGHWNLFYLFFLVASDGLDLESNWNRTTFIRSFVCSATCAAIGKCCAQHKSHLFLFFVDWSNRCWPVDRNFSLFIYLIDFFFAFCIFCFVLLVFVGSTYRVLEMMWPMQLLLCSPVYNTLYLIF